MFCIFGSQSLFGNFSGCMVTLSWLDNDYVIVEFSSHSRSFNICLPIFPINSIVVNISQLLNAIAKRN